MSKTLFVMLIVAICLRLLYSLADPRTPIGFGASMQSSDGCRDGQRTLFVRPWRALKTNDIIYVAVPQMNNETYCKRIKGIRGHKLFLVGDNTNDSMDSRNWGLVPEDHVIGLCVARLPRCFDGQSLDDFIKTTSPNIDKDLQLKKRSAPLLFTSDFPAQYNRIVSGNLISWIGFIVGKTHPTQIVPVHGQIAIIYYFGQGARVNVGNKITTLRITDVVTATTVDVRNINQLSFQATSDGFEYVRVWFYTDPGNEPRPTAHKA